MTKRHVLIAVIACGWLTAGAAHAQVAPAGQSQAGVDVTPFVSLGSSATSGIGASVRWRCAPASVSSGR